MSALGIILLTLLLGMYELRRNVLRPIHFLIDSTQHFRRGHHVPALVTGYQEFQTLSNSFNDMADTISEHQAKLNQEVLNKTRHLTQANQLLKLLYDFSNQLNQEPVTLSKLHHLLENFSKINPSFGFTLCLHDHLKLNESSTSGPLLKNDTVLVSSKDSISIHSHSVEELQTGKTDLLSSEICSTGNCDQCALKARSTTRIYPISAQNNYWGELMVHQQSEEDDTTITKELVQVLVSLVKPSIHHPKTTSARASINTFRRAEHHCPRTT